MVDVPSPQQALRAYSRAKEYSCGILCDARRGESNRWAAKAARPREQRRAPSNPEPPQGQHRDGSSSGPLASHTRYRSGAVTPGRDEHRPPPGRTETLRDRGSFTVGDVCRGSARITPWPGRRSPSRIGACAREGTIALRDLGFAAARPPARFDRARSPDPQVRPSARVGRRGSAAVAGAVSSACGGGGATAPGTAATAVGSPAARAVRARPNPGAGSGAAPAGGPGGLPELLACPGVLRGQDVSGAQCRTRTVRQRSAVATGRRRRSRPGGSAGGRSESPPGAGRRGCRIDCAVPSPAPAPRFGTRRAGCARRRR
jgi:hypothetical protein